MPVGLPVGATLLNHLPLSPSRTALVYDAGTRHGSEQLLDLRRAMHEVVRPELVNRVLDQLDERDEKTPRVRAVHNQPLQKHPRDLLLHRLGVGLRE